MWIDKVLEGFNAIIAHKQKKKILRKAAEELSELTTRLLQRLNDKGKVNDKAIIEEIVDVEMHILLLKSLFSDNDFEQVKKEKMEKFLNSRDYKYYTELKNKKNETKG